MSDVCGIFNKPCPQCATTLAKSAVRCGCGYSFTDESASTLAQTLAEEKLYEDYLLARVSQTAQAAIEAQAQQKQKPADAALSSAALAAMEAAESARRDLAAQSARVEELRLTMLAEAPDANTNVRTDAAATLQPATSQPVASAPAPSAPSQAESSMNVSAPASTRAAEVARAAEALRNELTKLRSDTDRAHTPARLVRAGKRDAQSPAPTATAVDSTSMRPTISKPVATASATDAPKPEVSVAPSLAAAPTATPVQTDKKRCPECDTAVIASAHRCRCGFAFVPAPAQTAPVNVPKIEDVLARANELKQARRESAQAEKAARIRAARLARAAKKPTPSPCTEATPAESAPVVDVSVTPVMPSAAAPAEPIARPATPSPPVRHLGAQLAPARPLVTAAAREVKECPNCTATVATHASRCKCGFEFRDAIANVMPALRLDDGELLKVQDLYVRR